MNGQVARLLDCEASTVELNPGIIVGLLVHCPPSSKWAAGCNTGEVKGGERSNWQPYLTMPATQDACPI